VCDSLFIADSLGASPRPAIVARADPRCGESAAGCVDGADARERARDDGDGMEPSETQPLLTVLTVAGAALLMVRAGLAKKQLRWRSRRPRRFRRLRLW
jgi:hypothetical protein